MLRRDSPQFWGRGVRWNPLAREDGFHAQAEALCAKPQSQVAATMLKGKALIGSADRSASGAPETDSRVEAPSTSQMARQL